MRALRLFAAALPLALCSCGSITVPAAVRMSSGEVLTGTTTASVEGGRFQVATPTGTVVCRGNYDAFDTRPTISAPVSCSDGRYGTITVTRAPDGRSGAGSVRLADGTSGSVAFGSEAGDVLTGGGFGQGSYASLYPADTANTYPPAPASPSRYGSYSPSRVYTGNCPTPESIDAAGRRCGARSAASRPGGYDGYGSWARTSYGGGGSTYVRGYFRKNGTYVRPHYRRR